MAEPPNLPTDNTNATPSTNTHPGLHNDANAAINDLHDSVPRLLGQGELPDGQGVSLDATGGAVALEIEGLEITTPGPIMCTYQNIWELTGPGEVDHHYTVERVGGGGVGASGIVWVQASFWEDLRLPFQWRFAVNTPPGTYKIGWRLVLLSDTFVTPGGVPNQSLMSVYTAPPGLVDLDSDPSF